MLLGFGAGCEFARVDVVAPQHVFHKGLPTPPVQRLQNVRLKHPLQDT